jgi:hypothetical protein
MVKHSVRTVRKICVNAIVVGASVAAASNATAQERAPVSTPLKVQVVLSRYDGDKKLASMPYTMLVNAGDRDNRVTLRMGVALPIATGAKDGPAVSFHDVGTNMDCTATLAEGGRYRINLAVNHTSVYESEQSHLQAAVPRPGASAQLIRSFTSSFFLNLKDGETGQSIAATDPVTGEVMKIDVTVAVVKS